MIFEGAEAALALAPIAFLAGFIHGLSGTLFGAGGPPYAIYLSHRALSKEQFRATMTLTTIFSIGLRLVAFAVTGLLMQDGVWLTAAAAIPAGLLAVYLASRIFRVISREMVMRAVGVLLLASGASISARNVPDLRCAKKLVRLLHANWTCLPSSDVVASPPPL